MTRFQTLVPYVMTLTVFAAACGGDHDDPPTSVEDADALAFVYASKPTTPVLVVYRSGEALTVLSDDGGATASGAVFGVPDLAPLLVEGGDDDLPTRAYVDGYTFVFRNWQQTTVDVGVVNPDGVAELFPGVDWSDVDINSPMLVQGSPSAQSAIGVAQGFINAGACVIGEVVAVRNGGLAIPIGEIACRTLAAPAAVVVLEETAPDSPWAEGVEIAGSALAAAGCAIAGPRSAAGCLDVALTVVTGAIDEASAVAQSAGEALQELSDALRSADVWQGAELLETLRHRGFVRSVAFSPDGDTLVSGSDDTVRLWDVDARQEIAARPVPGSYGYVAFSPDGDTLAIDRGWSITLWDANAREEIAVLRGHERSVFAIAFSRNGRTLASAGGDDTARLWDVRGRQEIATLDIPGFVVNAVAFSPGGGILATGSYMAEPLRLWDVRTAKQIAALHGHTDNVRAVAFSPDGMILASGSDDGTVKLWDVHARQEVGTLDDGRPRQGRSGAVYSVVFSPDGQTLAAGVRDELVHLWDVNARREVAALAGHRHGFVSVAFSPDGETLASGSGDGMVKLWGKTP
ncbi:WD40 repeat domain-containing protein [Candidatus Poribacteria bacterium]|jgi:hypothetical protein|nr:WD40 repeat domain-containing protein [Candidatus Poribacteria bacterium]MBT5532469.1 WD40 repeat domain-containing protein [Candidatus Poribacteria bacterium]MBT5713649.1 WD40 repeat domain-containing protein [Candidatus Poribacteria bacterium]MBT7096872.1 WD40 repeat domain-containing protein [Candidatus Poribacteria bacterium]MBT7805430.1 WD40 repeat domain-containing protein [Candidatus Poribacteria bacterium]